MEEKYERVLLKFQALLNEMSDGKLNNQLIQQIDMVSLNITGIYMDYVELTGDG